MCVCILIMTMQVHLRIVDQHQDIVASLEVIL